MGYGDPYITVEDLKAYLRIDSASPAEEDDMEDAVRSATMEVIAHCSRDFNRDTAGTGTGTAEAGALYVDTSALAVPAVYSNTGTSEFPVWSTYLGVVTTGTGPPVNGVTVGGLNDLYRDDDEYGVDPTAGWYWCTGTDTWARFPGTVLAAVGTPVSSPGPTTRLFVSRYPTWVNVDDFYTTTGLTIETGTADTWDLVGGTEYQLRPLNGMRDGMPGWPYFRIDVVGYGMGLGDSSFPNVRVTAHWGWSAIPEPVKRATKILAAETFKLREAPFGVAGWADFGVVRVRDLPKVAKLLYPYEKDRVKASI